MDRVPAGFFALGRIVRFAFTFSVRDLRPETEVVSGGDTSGPSLFKNRNGDGVLWTVRSGALPGNVTAIMEHPDQFLAGPGAVIADSALITLGRIRSQKAGEPDLMLRRLNYGRWSHRFRDVFRMTRAERAFWSAVGMEAAGVSTARPYAVGVRRILRWPKRAYLLTEWVSEAETLEAKLERERGLPREWVLQLADLLAALHANGFSHRDLKSSNILLRAEEGPCLIDLDGVRRFRALPESRAVADLGRLAWEFRKCRPQFLRWNGYRFLKRYCDRRGMKVSLKALARQVAEPTLRRLKQGVDYWKL